jgi:hypothetical protein
VVLVLCVLYASAISAFFIKVEFVRLIKVDAENAEVQRAQRPE